MVCVAIYQPMTPTPANNEAVFQALERAEAEAREALRSPTPGAAAVEKDWCALRGQELW